MSGGFFEYQEYRLQDMANLLRLEIAKCRKKPDWTSDWSRYSDEFIDEMSLVYNQLVDTAAKMHRIDWVLCGDDGEDQYEKRLKIDLAKIEFDDPAKDDKWLEQEKLRLEEIERDSHGLCASHWDTLERNLP